MANEDEKNIEDDEDLLKLGARLTRGGEFSAYERLLSSHLIEAISATALVSICHISTAALMLKNEHRDKLEENKGTVTDIYTVAHILNNVRKETIDNIETNSVLLDTVNKKILQEWTKRKSYEHFIPPSPDNATERHPNYIKKEKEGGIEFLIYSSRHLTSSGLQQMINDFVMWAFPKAQNIAMNISSLVNPQTFSDMLKVYTTAKRE